MASLAALPLSLRSLRAFLPRVAACVRPRHPAAPHPPGPPRGGAAPLRGPFWGARRAYGTVQRGRESGEMGAAVSRAEVELGEVKEEQVIAGVSLRDAERMLEVRWRGGATRLYPYVWLRDSCTCAECFLASAQARRSLMARLDTDTGVAGAEPARGGEAVSVVWPDGHRSEFSASWLRDRCFSDEARSATQEELFLEERELWGSDMAERMPSFSFDEVLSSDEMCLAWLTTLRRLGLALLTGAPTQRGQVLRLAERVGFLRLTFYGLASKCLVEFAGNTKYYLTGIATNVWDVQDKSDANNVAYTAGSLPPHTDYPALTHPPGVQFLHCVRAARRGGASLLVDGFRVSEQLRRRDPASFRLLAETPLNFVDVGADLRPFHVRSRNRVIELDERGRVSRLNLNHATRDSVLDVPAGAVRRLYAALSLFSALTEDPGNQVTFTLAPGDLITFDNWRLLHGRSAYTDSAADAGGDSATGAGRLLEGGYLDWDVVLSKLRLLRDSLGRT